MSRKYRGKNIRNSKVNRKSKIESRLTDKETCKRVNESFDSVQGSKTNDPSWYGNSAQLLGDASRISFNNPAGLDVNLQPTDDPDSLLYNKINHVRFPGIMALDVYTGPGTSSDNSSAVNIAAKNIYSFVRHANSGHANYDAPDLMLYLLAVDNAYMWYATLVRLYGTLMIYDSNNRYMPEALVKAQGFDFTNLVQHLADLRFTINRFVKQIGSLCVPNDLNVFARHAWLYSNYFMDSTTPKSHFYLYRPAGFHFYNETSEAGRLDWVEWRHLSFPDSTVVDYIKYDGIVEICNRFANLLLGSEDIGIMSGDILKAYGNDKLMALAMIPDDFALLPKSDDLHVLEQFHNATINGSPNFGDDGTGLDITQDIKTGALLWQPQIFFQPSDEWCADYILGKNRIFDMPIADPDPDSVMEATRMMTMAENDAMGPIMCGTEFVADGYIYTIESSSNGPVIKTHRFASAMRTDVTTLCRLSMFKWHPNVISATPIGPNEKPTAVDSIGLWYELDNYTVLEREALRKMHQVAQLSLWDVPQMGIYKG